MNRFGRVWPDEVHALARVGQEAGESISAISRKHGPTTTTISKWRQEEGWVRRPLPGA